MRNTSYIDTWEESSIKIISISQIFFGFSNEQIRFFIRTLRSRRVMPPFDTKNQFRDVNTDNDIS